GEAIPAVPVTATLGEALVEMTKKGLGMTAVLDGERRLAGIFTDGDLRRALDRNVDLRHARVADVMTRNGKTVTPDILAAEALRLMEENKINGLMVIDEHQAVVGAFNMHDLLRAGVV
ncbi:MAG TPA: CBS domain-containing protein, partial [Chromatiales bacterium]|nr:CBS domain-containing protein [Chromatiales bacterium]